MADTIQNTSVLTDDTYSRMDLLRNQLKSLVTARVEDSRSNVTSLWNDILNVQNYVFDLSPPHLARIRLHSNYFTRFSPSTFLRFIRDGRDAEMAAPVSQYRFFVEDVPEKYWLSEPPLVDTALPTGFPWKGKAINPEIVRYQACLSNLYTSGIIDYVSTVPDPVIVEIGGGFGGLAHGPFQALPDLPMRYAIIDIPDLLLFQGCYLMANRPREHVTLCQSPDGLSDLAQARGTRQLALIPISLNAQIDRLRECHLVISMASLQEMTPEQVEYYSRQFAKQCTGYMYSDNTDCHPDNHKLKGTGVSSLLERDWHLHPSKSAYDSRKDTSGPWCHRTYIGTSRVQNVSDARGSIRLITGNNKKGEGCVYNVESATLESATLAGV